MQVILNNNKALKIKILKIKLVIVEGFNINVIIKTYILTNNTMFI